MNMKKKLLVAEDEEVIRLLIKKAVGDRFHMEEAANGMAALAKAKSIEYDCVLTDIQMPGMNGLELLVSLKKARPRVKVIVMTGSGDEFLNFARSRGADSVLEKPFGVDELMASLSGI